MTKVRALRGVCVGVDRHLSPGDCANVDAASAQFLTAISAVELVTDEPAEPQSKPPAKAGKKE